MTEIETWEGEGGAAVTSPGEAARTSIHRVADAIKPGTILIKGGIPLPSSMLLRMEPYSGEWLTVTDERTAFEKEVEKAGWTFFFMAGEIKVTVFDFDRQKAERAAWKRLIANVRSQGCNCIQITRIIGKSFLGVPYLSICGHPRHLQKGLVFSKQG